MRTKPSACWRCSRHWASAIRSPSSYLLRAADFQLGPVKEVAIVGPEPGASELVRAVRGQLRPHLVLAGGSGAVPLLDGRGPVGGQAAAYVCEHFSCQAPVTRAQDLIAAL